MSLRHRHGYPAALHRGLPAVTRKTTQKFPPPAQTSTDRVTHRARPISARFEPVGV